MKCFNTLILFTYMIMMCFHTALEFISTSEINRKTVTTQMRNIQEENERDKQINWNDLRDFLKFYFEENIEAIVDEATRILREDYETGGKNSQWYSQGVKDLWKIYQTKLQERKRRNINDKDDSPSYLETRDNLSFTSIKSEKKQTENLASREQNDEKTENKIRVTVETEKPKDINDKDDSPSYLETRDNLSFTSINSEKKETENITS